MNFAFSTRRRRKTAVTTTNPTLCLHFGQAQFFPFISFSFCINFLSRLAQTALRQTGGKLFQPEKADLSLASLQQKSPEALTDCTASLSLL
jgi:hypothetical protein